MAMKVTFALVGAVAIAAGLWFVADWIGWL